VFPFSACETRFFLRAPLSWAGPGRARSLNEFASRQVALCRVSFSAEDDQPDRLALSPLAAQPGTIEEMLAARSIVVSHETVRQWALKFGREFVNRIRRRLPCTGDKWHLEEVAIKVAGCRTGSGARWIRSGWCWMLLQSRRDKHAAKRLLRKLLKR
jgi:hypothetical protein